MKCEIAIKVNNGKFGTNVKKYGAKALANNAVQSLDDSTFKVSINPPTEAILRKNDLFDNLASYVFSNTSLTGPDGISALTARKTGKTDALKKLEASGANMYKGFADFYFRGNPQDILSPTPGSTSRLITQGQVPTKSDSRTFLRITPEVLENAKTLAIGEFADVELEPGDSIMSEVKTLTDEGIEFFIISALYRGFDLSFSSAIDPMIIDRAISKYNKHLKPLSQKVHYVSSSPNGNAMVVGDIDNFIGNIDMHADFKKPVITTNNSALLLNAFIPENQRRTFGVHKKVTNRAKMRVANKIISIFSTLMPHLDIITMTNAQILEAYGEGFSGRKGFNIGNKIILNLNHFDSSTVFHEFGHYYVEWLRIENPAALSKLLQITSEKYGAQIQDYTSLYDSTGIQYSPDQILEEIFVDNLGMKAAATLEQGLNEVDENGIEESVDNFMKNFLIKLTRDITITPGRVGFTLDTTIANIFNIGIQHAHEMFSTPLLDDLNSSELKSFSRFFIPEITVRETFDKLVSRGLIKKLPNGDIVLTDEFGNRYNASGEIGPNASYKMNAWDTPNHILENNKFINKIEGYLYAHRNQAGVMFKVDKEPDTIIPGLRKMEEMVELDEDLHKYTVEGKEYESTTEYIAKEFTSDADPEVYVISHVYYAKVREFKTLNREKGSKGILDVEKLNKAAADHARKYMTADMHAEAFKKDAEDAKEIFKFKTNEGTYIHALGEMLFRAINLSEKLPYASEREGGKLHFARPIAKAIAHIGSPKSTAYFKNMFFDHLQGTALGSSHEAKKFSETYQTLLSGMTEASSADAAAFLKLVMDEVIPALNRLSGPLEIIPEFRAYSETLGLAGTMDLLVIDGKGQGHIFDYKTKEVNKYHYWKSETGLNMKGTMSSRQENAESKAAIQTSIYKIMLGEMGITTGPAHIFYVENRMYDENYKHPNDPEVTSPLYESKKEALASDLKYTPENLRVLQVPNTTAELLMHFENEGKRPTIDSSTSPGEAIKSFMSEITGGEDIDIGNDVTATARTIYEQSISLQSKGDVTNATLNSLYAHFGLAEKNTRERGWKVVLAGNIKIELDPKFNGDEDAIIAEIHRLLIERRDVKGVANEFESVFGSLQTGDTGTRALKTYSKEKAFRGMLSGVDPLMWSLSSFGADSNFGLNFSEVEMVTNEVTGESRICIINHDKDDPIVFSSGHTNLMGNYISTSAFKNKLPSIKWENGKYKMRFIKATLLAIMQKKLNPDFTVSSIIANRDFDDNSDVPYIYDMSTLLAVTKAMIEVARDNGAVIPEAILETLDDPKLFDSKEYQKDPLKSLHEFLSMTTGGLIRTQDLFKKGSTGEENKLKLRNIISDYADERAEVGHVLDSLYDFRNSLEQSVYFEVEDRINSDLWTMTDRSILFLNGFNSDLLAKEASFISQFLMATSKASNSYMAAMNRKTYEGASRIREDFMSYKVEHNKLIEALAEEEGYNINVLGEAVYRHSMAKIFDELYVTDNTDRASAFQLKHPDQVSGVAKKAYLKYLRKTFEQFASRSTLSGKTVDIPYGWMPLTAATSGTLSSNADSIERARESMDRMLEDDKYFGDKALNTIDSVFSVENRYKNQFPQSRVDKIDGVTVEGSMVFLDEDRQYRHKRRQMLGIEYNGQPSANAKDRPLHKIESNLENVMDTFVIAALDAEHYKDVSAFGRALFYTIKRQEKTTKKTYANLIDTVQIIQKRNVLHQEDQDSSKVQKRINKIVTGSAIAGTVTQALLETFTNPLVTASNYVGDKLYGAMFKGAKRDFSFKSYQEAIKIIWTDYGKNKKLVQALDVLYGITLFDVKSVKDTFNKLEKNSMWQSKHFMSVNKLMLDNWQRISMVAYMLEEGSFYAHSLNEETGELTYDETKDDRFRILPTDNEKTRIDKKMRYKATKLEMGKQRNGLTGDRTTLYEDRKLRRAWTQYDATYVKELIVETYASMDESSRSLASFYTYMGLITKMRQWLFPRMPRYFQKPLSAAENQSAARLQRIEDPDAENGYRYEWRGEETEGIWYTILHVVREIGEHRTNVLKDGTLSNKQKKNIATLMGDLIVSGVLAAAATGIFRYGLDDEERRDPLNNLIYLRFMMATTDVFFIASLFEISSGNSSMFIPVAIIRRMAGSYLDVLLIPLAMVTEDDYSEDDALATINNALGNTHGVYRTVEMGIDKVTDDE